VEYRGHNVGQARAVFLYASGITEEELPANYRKPPFFPD